jgi:hypothetical protein
LNGQVHAERRAHGCLARNKQWTDRGGCLGDRDGLAGRARIEAGVSEVIGLQWVSAASQLDKEVLGVTETIEREPSSVESGTIIRKIQVSGRASDGASGVRLAGSASGVGHIYTKKVWCPVDCRRSTIIRTR